MQVHNNRESKAKIPSTIRAWSEKQISKETHIYSFGLREGQGRPKVGRVWMDEVLDLNLVASGNQGGNASQLENMSEQLSRQCSPLSLSLPKALLTCMKQLNFLAYWLQVSSFAKAL